MICAQGLLSAERLDNYALLGLPLAEPARLRQTFFPWSCSTVSVVPRPHRDAPQGSPSDRGLFLFNHPREGSSEPTAQKGPKPGGWIIRGRCMKSQEAGSLEGVLGLYEHMDPPGGPFCYLQRRETLWCPSTMRIGHNG